MEASNSITEITAALKVLNPENAVTELRMPNTPSRGTISGYFDADSMDMLAKIADAWSGSVPVYITINPVKPELLARAKNHTVDHVRTTTGDQDIVKRIWLPIDLDPVRPSGISSTNEEHEAALERARQVAEFTKTLGWPDPIKADSGNGAHVLFRIDLPNDKASEELVKKVLQALDLRYTDDRVHVDTGVYNAARIWKLYGTVACKGENTQERPHRTACIIETPETLQVVTLEQLQALADTVPVEPPSNGRKIIVERWAKKFNVTISPPKSWNGGKVFIINPCPWNPEHTNGSAYIVQFASGAIAAGCHHDSCSENGWPELRDKYEPGWRAKEPQPRDSQADLILKEIGDIELFQDNLDQAYARIQVDKHIETLPIKGKHFRLWMQNIFGFAQLSGYQNGTRCSRKRRPVAGLFFFPRSFNRRPHLFGRR